MALLAVAVLAWPRPAVPDCIREAVSPCSRIQFSRARVINSHGLLALRKFLHAAEAGRPSPQSNTPPSIQSKTNRIRMDRFEARYGTLRIRMKA